MSCQYPRDDSEVLHGRFLARHGAETIWGWGTPAGRLRALRRARLIIEASGMGPGRRVLEIGCGTGLFTEMFARAGATLLAVDISPELLRIARSRGLPPERVQFLNKRFEDCDVEGPFDAVVGSSILHHLDIRRALAKIRSLLKSGGCVSFAEPNMLNPQIFLQKNIPWLKRRLGDSPDETAFVRWKLIRLMTSLGYRQVAVTPFDWLHPAVPARHVDAVSALGRRLEKTKFVNEFAGSLHIRAVG